MAKKSRKGGRGAPQPGGPPRNALGSAMKKRSTGGWRNAKEAGTGTSPGSTDRTTPGATSSLNSEYGGGGRSAGSSYAGGSLSMPGVVMVKRPTAGPTHFGSAQPAGGAARKYRKMKAPGK